MNDGDTFEIETGERVRLLGIDTLEKHSIVVIIKGKNYILSGGVGQIVSPFKIKSDNLRPISYNYKID